MDSICIYMHTYSKILKLCTINDNTITSYFYYDQKIADLSLNDGLSQKREKISRKKWAEEIQLVWGEIRSIFLKKKSEITQVG